MVGKCRSSQALGGEQKVGASGEEREACSSLAHRPIAPGECPADLHLKTRKPFVFESGQPGRVIAHTDRPIRLTLTMRVITPNIYKCRRNCRQN